MDLNDDRLARLEINAQSFRYDPVLDRAADLFHTDRAAFNRLPVAVKAEADIYADLRQCYRDAVAAGVVPADRGPAAA